jgi:hypothetical protein
VACDVAAFWRPGWARKAARKPPKKGRLVVMVFAGVAGVERMAAGLGASTAWSM